MTRATSLALLASLCCAACSSDSAGLYLQIELPGDQPIGRLVAYALVRFGDQDQRFMHAQLLEPGDTEHIIRLDVEGPLASASAPAAIYVVAYQASAAVAWATTAVNLGDDKTHALILRPFAEGCDEDQDGFIGCDHEACCGDPILATGFGDCDDADADATFAADAVGCGGNGDVIEEIAEVHEVKDEAADAAEDTPEEVCVPDCEDKACTDNGCGQLCPCEDRDVCTSDQCVEGQCVFEPVEEGTKCSETAAETMRCKAGFCVAQSDQANPGSSVPPGSFWMGSPAGCPGPDGYPDDASCAAEPGRAEDETLHLVSLSRPIEALSREVSHGLIRSYTLVDPAYFGVHGAGEDCQIFCSTESGSWYDALVLANALSYYKGLPLCYAINEVTCERFDDSTFSPAYSSEEIDAGKMNWSPCGGQGPINNIMGVKAATVALNGVDTPYDCLGYRLPTEAEWEYLARAGDQTPFHTSEGNDGAFSIADPTDCDAPDEHLHKIARHCLQGVDGTPGAPGGKAPNALGLYDMSGNVWEWVWDAYAPYAAAPEGEALVDPVVNDGERRVIRGGGYDSVPTDCRSARRDKRPPAARDKNLGFRLVRTLEDLPER